MAKSNVDKQQRQDNSSKTSPRKSAAVAKPATKAAYTVRIQTSEKTPAQKRAARKEAQAKDRAEQKRIQQRYSKPDTERYKRLRVIWGIGIAAAVALTVLAWFSQDVKPEWLSIVLMVAAYALVAFSFYIEIAKIRKERTAYQERMLKEEKSKKKKKGR